METNKQFKCKDEILLKDKEDKYAKWFYAIFSHYCENISYITISGGTIYNLDFYKILPYKGNEELVGTTNESEEEIKLKKGEWLMVADGDLLAPEEWRIRTYDSTTNNNIRAFNNSAGALVGWEYVVRFKDFDPSNMQETLKHILCVKNGKIIRYKG